MARTGTLAGATSHQALGARLVGGAPGRSREFIGVDAHRKGSDAGAPAERFDNPRQLYPAARLSSHVVAERVPSGAHTIDQIAHHLGGLHDHGPNRLERD